MHTLDWNLEGQWSLPRLMINVDAGAVAEKGKLSFSKRSEVPIYHCHDCAKMLLLFQSAVDSEPTALASCKLTNLACEWLE